MEDKDEKIVGREEFPASEDGDLADSNEQEQFKDGGFDGMPEAATEKEPHTYSEPIKPEKDIPAEPETIPVNPETGEPVKPEIPPVNPEVGEPKEPLTVPAKPDTVVLPEFPERGEGTEELPVRPACENNVPDMNVFHWNYDEQVKSDFTRKANEKKHGILVYSIVMTAAFIACFGILIAILLMGGYNNKETDGGTDSYETVGDVGDAKVVYVREYDPSSGLLTAPELYEKCLPAVVSIYSETSSSTSTGSGFIMTSDGYIVTANHVISGAQTITVILSDGKQYAATLKGADEMSDLALLKIEASGLTAATIGKSSELLIGEKVAAIGTPVAVSYSGSYVSGEVSYNNRVVYINNNSTNKLEKKMTVIQTSAPVNKGNSGCPLFDEYGKVVGIVTMKLGDKYVGMGFALPIDGALPILEAMKDGSAVTDEMVSKIAVKAAKLGINGVASNVNGIKCVKVSYFDGTSYDAAKKLQKNDLILKIADAPVESMSEIENVIAHFNPGDTVAVMVVRNGHEYTYKIILGS